MSKISFIVEKNAEELKDEISRVDFVKAFFLNKDSTGWNGTGDSP